LSDAPTKEQMSFMAIKQRNFEFNSSVWLNKFRFYMAMKSPLLNVLAPVDQKLDSAIHWINHYPVDNTIGFPNTYPLDSDLSDG